MSVRIKIVAHDPKWKDHFLENTNLLASLLSIPGEKFQHIGSTSVPGLASKNVIDMQVSCADTDELHRVCSRFVEAGFAAPIVMTDHRPGDCQSSDLEWEKCFLKTKALPYESHIHIRVAGRYNQIYPLVFRDYLRENPRPKRYYEVFKYKLAEISAMDKDSYCEAKDPFCDLIVDAAKSWAKDCGWAVGGVSKQRIAAFLAS